MLTQEELKALLHYNCETGAFVWLKKTSAKIRIKVGDVAGYRNSHGYLVIKISGKTYKAHRLAWLYMYGEWPPDQIDHINRVRHDNRIVNLRRATHWENGQNRSDNKSGAPGVYWDKANSKWKAQIMVNGKNKHLGRFTNKRDAADARKSAEIKFWCKE